jgi:ATP-dependent DNA ligase
MLARLTREVPREGGLWFEPKWDGFRCLVRRDGDDVDMRSRTGRPLSRYFPELVTALQNVTERTYVVDSEIIATRDARVDFAALMGRLHPASSRVERLAAETPATLFLFDALGIGARDLVADEFHDRRRALEDAFADALPPIHLTTVTSDPDVAAGWLALPSGHGIDGVMAKDPAQPYSPGKRTMLKVKAERTADCVVAGFRLFGEQREVGSLLLGLYDGDELRHVGVVTSFPKTRRVALLDELLPDAVPLAEHPWRDGYATEGGSMGRLRGAAGRWLPEMGLDWFPLPPGRVVEVAYDQVDGIRFRHPARFRRWREDRDAASCTVDQLTEAS